MCRVKIFQSALNMESLFLRDRLTLAAVLGAGVVIGVSSLYVYFKYTRTLSRDLNRLTRTIEHLDKEIQELKSTRCTTQHVGAVASSSSAAAVKSKRRFSSTGESVGSQMSSSGDDNDEYFDVSDESDVNHSWTAFNGEIPVSSSSDADLKQLFEDVDLMFAGDGMQHQQAYDKLMAVRNQHDGNVDVMWRLARACYLLTTMYENDPERKKEITFEGLKYATVALACDDSSGDVHKWYAAMLGRTTDFLGIQEKIKNGYTFKKHVDAAINLLPDDHSLYFMRGRWCYEVAMLSWIERKVASTLFATPPTSTFEEAREQFLQVEKLFPKKWKENMLYIAKCYVGERNYSKAVEWLDEAVDIECKNSEEKAIHAEVSELLSKYDRYRATT